MATGENVGRLGPTSNLSHALVTATGSSTARSLADHFADVVNVAGEGVAGDGGDETAKIQSAITKAIAAGKDLHLPHKTLIATSLTINGSLRIFGSGTIKQKASTTGDLLTVSGTSTVLRLDGITLDGNEQNQIEACLNKTIYFTSIGTASAPAALYVSNCSFVNGAWADVSVREDAARSTHNLVSIRGCRFLGGREGTSQTYTPRYIDLRSPDDYVIEGNFFNRLAAPVAFGRCGIAAYDGFSTTGEEARGIISGNYFLHVGRSQAASTLGAIDLYTRGRSTVIGGNSMIASVGRAIQVKADTANVAITGNTIDGLVGGSDGTMAGQIVMNAAVKTSATPKGGVAIVGNTLYGSGYDGIAVNGKDADPDAEVYASGIVVTGNVVHGATRRAIGVLNVHDAVVTGNSIVGAIAGMYVDQVQGGLLVSGNRFDTQSGNAIDVSANNTLASLTITGNQIANAGSRGVSINSAARGSVTNNHFGASTLASIRVTGTTGGFLVMGNSSTATVAFDAAGTNTALVVRDNAFSVPISFTERLLTIASGAVTVWADWHYVDTEGGAASDELLTITGGYDGQILTLRAANSERSVVVKDGTNLRLAGDFTLDHSQDSITLRWCNDAWVELSRSDNAT